MQRIANTMQKAANVVLTLIAMLVVTAPAFCQHIKCGVERWDVKVMTDRDAAAVNLDEVKKATVHDLVQLPAPVEPTARVAPVEDTLYEVTGLLIGYKLEADSDFHIVIQDPRTKETMIVEVPAPGCSKWPYATDWGDIRKSIESEDGKATKRFLRLKAPVPVLVQGVGFFDRCHGQTGRAKNCIELHPVLYFEFLDTSLPAKRSTKALR